MLLQLKKDIIDVLAYKTLIKNIVKSKFIKNDINIWLKEGKKADEIINIFTEKKRNESERGVLIFLIYIKLLKTLSYFAISLNSVIVKIKHTDRK